MTLSRRNHHRLLATGLLLALALAPGRALATDAEPAPPYPAPPPRAERAAPPRGAYYPPPPVRAVAPPPPLSPLMRAIYAPFYAAGLIVRYSVYYLIVAPFEVFSRTVSYGAQGGVDRRPRSPEEDQ